MSGVPVPVPPLAMASSITVVIDGEMMSPKDAAEYQDHQKDVEETDR